VTDTPFAIFCLIVGAVCAIGAISNLFAPLKIDEGLIGRALLILLFSSSMTFFGSLGGTGFALALGWSRLAYVLERAYVIGGFALMSTVILFAVYGTIFSLTRRKASD
jgi:hypothetical protein